MIDGSGVIDSFHSHLAATSGRPTRPRRRDQCVKRHPNGLVAPLSSGLHFLSSLLTSEMTIRNYLALVLIALIALVGAEYRSIKFKDCKSSFEILDVEADQCPGDHNYCPFLRGTRPRIRITFKANREVKSFDATVRARLAGVSVPFNLDEPNACLSSNITCPLQADQIYHYSQTVHILENYPKVSVQVNWLLNDPSNDGTETEQKREVCIIFMAKVVDPADIV